MRIRKWWDSDRDFPEGLELLKEAGGSSVLIRMMESSGPTRFNQDKLRSALGDLLELHTDASEQQEVQTGFPKYDPFTLPLDLQKEDYRKAQLYKEAGELRGPLIAAITDEQRAKIAGEIISKMNENAAIWEKIEYYLAHGHTRKETKILIPELATLSTAELARFKTNNASNLTKWRKKLNKLQGDEKEKLQEKIAEFTALQDQVKMILNEQ